MPTEAREQRPAGRIVLTYEDYCELPDDGRRYEILVTPTLFPGLEITLSSLWA